MRKILILLGLLAGSAFAQGIDLSDVRWVAPREQAKQNSFQMVDGDVSFKFPVVNKGGAWFVGQLQKEVLLTGKKFLNFSARSDDGQTHLVYFYIRRELQPNDQASFYSLVEVTPEWKTFNLRLERSNRTNAGKGYFVYTKGTKNCDIDLRKGGRLLTLQPVVQEQAEVSFKEFNLSEEPLVKNPKADAIAAEIAAHPKVQPYQFREIIKPGAVKAAGFCIVAPEAGNFAAAELSKYLEKATGAKFPVVAAPGDRNIILSVRPGEPEDAFQTELTDGKNLKITGNSPRALTYAVYDFLEKAAGVRWFAPFDYGEVVPRNPELAFPLFRDESAPSMNYRCPHYCSYTRQAGAEKHAYDMADWAFKNRYNVELERLKNRDKVNEFYAKRGGCIWLMEHAGHNFHKLIPPKTYFKDHPEFFCFDRATGTWKAEYAQLCTTSPGLVKELGKVADEYFKRNPEQRFFPLFQEDGARLWCQCPPCLALNPSGSNLAKATENNINLANNVQQEIRKKHPDRSVFTYAYGITVSPPEKILPVPGVRIMYCWYSDGNPGMMPWLSRAFSDVEKWSRLTDGNIVVYSYHYLNPRYMFNNEHVLINMFRTFNLLKIQGSNQESTESWGGVDAYLQYLGGRLPWNPWFDEEALKTDYFNTFYGAAGPAVRAYHDLLSERLSDKSSWLRMGLSQYGFIPEADLKKMTDYLETARQAVKDDPRASKAVAAQAGYLRYLTAYSAAMAAGDRFYRAPDAEKYQNALNAIETLKDVTKSLLADRIVSHDVQRVYTAWERNLKAAHEENLARTGVLKDYNILKTLNPWRFQTDPDAKGDGEQWFAADFNDSGWKQINSGKFWEDQGFPSYNGAGWYRATIEIPTGKPAALYFGGADERAWVYLDGKYIGGHHEGDVDKLWNEPFVIDIPGDIASGNHQLTVKVIDSAGKGGLWKDVLLLQKK
jgi:hypothetical protein